MKTSVVAILLSLLRDDLSRAPLPESFCRQAAARLPVDGVSLALMSDTGHHHVLATSGERARRVDEQQFTVGEGPSVDAWRSGRAVLVPDVREVATRRWPGLAGPLEQAGVMAVFSLPLQVGAIRLGVLGLHRLSAGPLGREDLAATLNYAEVAVTLLLHRQDQMLLGDGGLDPGLVSSGGASQVHHATGMISVQASVGLAEALLLLRAHAYSSDRRPDDVARDVVHRRLNFYPEHDDEVDR